MNPCRRTVAFVAIGLLLAAGVAAAETWWPPIADPPTGEREPGRWVWAELVTPDVGRAAEFYGAVFGWTFETYGPAQDLDTYTLVSSGGIPIAGMVFKKGDKVGKGRDARWVGLMSVADVDAAARKVTAGGGKTVIAPRQLGGRGRAALFADPEGALFGVITAAGGDPEDGAGDVNRWLWNELWADDPAKMAAFYQPLAGFEVLDGAASGESSGLRLATSGTPRAGILPKAAKVPSSWIPYINVASIADTVAKARAAGGHVVMEPTAAHGTSIAILLDPTGAPLAVAEWKRPATEAAR